MPTLPHSTAIHHTFITVDPNITSDHLLGCQAPPVLMPSDMMWNAAHLSEYTQRWAALRGLSQQLSVVKDEWTCSVLRHTINY